MAQGGPRSCARMIRNSQSMCGSILHKKWSTIAAAGFSLTYFASWRLHNRARVTLPYRRASFELESISVAKPKPKPSRPLLTEVRCAKCKHLESEHGRTGLRPCLAMVGDLLDRDFCTCNEFRVAIGRAALEKHYFLD